MIDYLNNKMSKLKDNCILSQKSPRPEFEKIQSNNMIPFISNPLNKMTNPASLKIQRPSKVKWNNFYKDENTLKTIEINSIESHSIIHQRSVKSNDIWSGYQQQYQHSPVLPNIHSNADKNKLLFKVSGELNTTYNYHIMNQTNNETHDKMNNYNYNTLIYKKINFKKYSNIINTNSPNQNKPSSSDIDIDESIRTNSVIDWSSFKHSKTNPNSINSSSSNSRFKTKTNILEIDKYLHV